MTSYNFSQVRERKTFSSSGQIQFVLFMQTGLRGFCLAPTRKKFLFSCTSSDRSSSSPPSQTDKMIWNRLSHFLIDLTEILAEGVFSILSCVVSLEPDAFFNKKPLTTTRAFVKTDVRSKAYLTTALSLEYIIPGPCFRDSVLLSAAVNNTLANIFPIWARGTSLDNPLPARSLLFLILLPIKIILLALINCSPLHIMDTFKEIPSWISVFENIFLFFKGIWASSFSTTQLYHHMYVEI